MAGGEGFGTSLKAGRGSNLGRPENVRSKGSGFVGTQRWHSFAVVSTSPSGKGCWTVAALWVN